MDYSYLVLNGRNWPGKLWLPKHVPENSIVIMTTWKTRHRSIGTTLTMPKIYFQIFEKQIRSCITLWTWSDSC